MWVRIGAAWGLAAHGRRGTRLLQHRFSAPAGKGFWWKLPTQPTLLTKAALAMVYVRGMTGSPAHIVVAGHD
jgi:hypothetical protein